MKFEQKISQIATTRRERQSEWTPLQLASFILGLQTAFLGACLLTYLSVNGTPLILRFDPEFEMNVVQKILKYLELSIMMLTGIGVAVAAWKNQGLALMVFSSVCIGALLFEANDFSMMSAMKNSNADKIGLLACECFRSILLFSTGVVSYNHGWNRNMLRNTYCQVMPV